MTTSNTVISHTPGPWGVPDTGTQLGYVTISKGTPGSWQGIVAQADAGNYARGQSEGLANACLIAAAPELLNICSWALTYLKADANRDHGDQLYTSAAKDRYAHAREVFRKAGGEGPV